MRRWTMAVTVMAMLALSFPAAAQPGVFAGAEQIAAADWLSIETRTRGTYYFALGLRGADPINGAYTYGFVGKGRCRVDRGPNFVSISCMGQARGHQLGTEDFEFDPALSSSRMRVKDKNYVHEVVWKGRGRSPSAGGQVFGNDGGVEVVAGMDRWATATGEIFGKRMPARSRGRFGAPGSIESFAFLGQGAYAIAFTSGDRSVTIEDGIATFEVDLRIPR